MGMQTDATPELRERVLAAKASGQPLRILGGASKQFYGRAVPGADLDVSGHRGIIAYDPAELVLTARAGTPLSEIDAALSAAGQCMPFEPPRFAATATLGGTLACGIAGPARAHAGAVKDFVLGVSLMDGEGRTLRFGGQVMKNVAGYDVSRALVGSLGTLGLILEVSMKVLPRPPHSATRVFDLDAPAALLRMNEWARRPSCLSATCWVGGRLYARLSGSQEAVSGAASSLGGEPLDDAEDFWISVREHTHAFFDGAGELMRVAVPALCPMTPGDDCLMEWNGAQRWLRRVGDAQAVRAAALSAGGFATRFRTEDRDGEVFQPVSAVQMRLQRSLKAVFDPGRIFNRGRLHAEL